MSHVKNVKRESDVVIPEAGEKYVGHDGTVSEVLEDFVDRDYEPTQEEVEQFAEFIGMNLPEDEEFLYIARNALKTPLPKEWKPCQMEDKEIYYFNFKTGEALWEHPMDDIARKTFEKEKERVTKLKAEGKIPASKTPASSSPSVAPSAATTSTRNNALNTSTHSTLNASTRLIFTSDGLLRKEPGTTTPPKPDDSSGRTSPVPAPTAASGAKSAPATTSNAKANSAALKKMVSGLVATANPASASSSPKVKSGAVISMKDPKKSSTEGDKGGAAKTASSATTTATSSSAATSSSLAIKTGGGLAGNSTRGSGGVGGGGGTSSAMSSSRSSPSQSSPILSEAEQKIEEKIRKEVAQDIQIRRDQNEAEMEKKLRDLRELYNKKTVELRNMDEKRRQTSREAHQELLDRSLQDARQRCQTEYSDELTSLEHQANTLATTLQRLKAEESKKGDAQKVQREVAEREAAASLADRMKQAVIDSDSEQRRSQREMEIEFIKKKKEMEKNSEAALNKMKETTQSKITEKIDNATKYAQDRKRRLELEKKNMERHLEALKTSNSKNTSGIRSSNTSFASSASSSFSTSQAPANPSDDEIAEMIRQINEKRDKEIEKLRATAAKEQAAIKRDKELELEKLHYLITQATKARDAQAKAKEAAIAAVAAVALAEAASKKQDSSIQSCYEKEQELAHMELMKRERAKIKSKVALEEQKRLKEVEQRRKEKLRAVTDEVVLNNTNTIAAAGAKSAGAGATAPPLKELERVTKECEEELETKKQLYKKMEDDLCEQLAVELDAKEDADESTLMEQALQQEMERYTADILSRRERLEKEYELRKQRLATQLDKLEKEAKEAALVRRQKNLESLVELECSKRVQQRVAEREKKSATEETRKKDEMAALKAEEDTERMKIAEKMSAKEEEELKELERKGEELRKKKALHEQGTASEQKGDKDPKSPVVNSAALQEEEQAMDKKVKAREGEYEQLQAELQQARRVREQRQDSAPLHLRKGKAAGHWILKTDHAAHMEELESLFAEQHRILQKEVARLKEQTTLAQQYVASTLHSSSAAPVVNSLSTPPPALVWEKENGMSPGDATITVVEDSEEYTAAGPAVVNSDALVSSQLMATRSPLRRCSASVVIEPSGRHPLYSSNDSLHTGDALRFLNFQQVDSARRQDLLRAAKQEWKLNVQEYCAAPEPIGTKQHADSHVGLLPPSSAGNLAMNNGAGNPNPTPSHHSPEVVVMDDGTHLVVSGGGHPLPSPYYTGGGGGGSPDGSYLLNLPSNAMNSYLNAALERLNNRLDVLTRQAHAFIYQRSHRNLLYGDAKGYRESKSSRRKSSAQAGLRRSRQASSPKKKSGGKSRQRMREKENQMPHGMIARSSGRTQPVEPYNPLQYTHVPHDNTFNQSLNVAAEADRHRRRSTSSPRPSYYRHSSTPMREMDVHLHHPVAAEISHVSAQRKRSSPKHYSPPRRMQGMTACGPDGSIPLDMALGRVEDVNNPVYHSGMVVSRLDMGDALKTKWLSLLDSLSM